MKFGAIISKYVVILNVISNGEIYSHIFQLMLLQLRNCNCIKKPTQKVSRFLKAICDSKEFCQL